MQYLTLCLIPLLSAVMAARVEMEWGMYYIGDVNSSNQPHGQGTLHYSDGKVSYVGDWVNGKAEGDGKYISENGDTVCTAKFVNDEMNGKGMCTSPEGTYEGDFLNNKAHGNGKWTGTDGEKCEGEFKNDMMNGHGVCTDSNGDKYEGNLVNDVASGQGTWVGAKGDKYVGEFRNDQANGQGKYWDRNGKLVYEGRFVNDEPADI